MTHDQNRELVPLIILNIEIKVTLDMSAHPWASK